MSIKRRKHSAAFKKKVVLEALRESRTANEIASAYEIHPVQVRKWKSQAVECLEALFTDQRGRERDVQAMTERESRLMEKIGRQATELDWLKKKPDWTLEAKRRCIDLDSREMPISHQCATLGLPRSSFYYQPANESEENLRLMHRIDELFTERPYYGSRRMTVTLQQEGHKVNRKRVQRLMRKMGLEAVYPKPRFSQADESHKKYPYLLRGVSVDHPNQVWSTDITYVRMNHGFMYLVEVIDWMSRYVLAWQLSNTLGTAFCIEALERALEQGTPSIFNTDQGAQFTSTEFTKILTGASIQVSMDGRGRALDNVFVERLWRSVK